MRFIKKIVIVIIFILPFCVISQAATPPPSETTSDLPLKDIQRFTTAVNQIKKYYVETVNDKRLFEDSIRGMLAGLDPHSSYLDEQEYKDLQELTTGQFGGLGIEVIEEGGMLKVISPLDDTPAQKAGIKAGDIIIRINNQSIKGMSLRDAVSKMRGPQGSKVTLTIFRKNAEKPLTFNLIREVIHIDSVKSQVLAKQYGYIRLSNFQTTTAKDLEKAIKSLQENTNGQLKGIVLDLRNNPGGLLDSAIDVSNEFLDSSKLKYDRLIVYTKGRLPGAQFQAKASGEDLTHGIPIVVLINEGSASGSEIVAGALQDQKRAVLVGATSFGKGSVQTVIPIDDKTAIKLTTALYYTPAGRSIQAKGIVPDIIVDEIKIPAAEKDKLNYLKESDLSHHLNNGNGDTLDDERDQPEVPGNVSLKTDFQLREALDILKALVALK